MAKQLRSAYDRLFAANEYAYKLSRQELTTKIRTVTGAASSDPNLRAVVGTFEELAKLANFEESAEETKTKKRPEESREEASDRPAKKSLAGVTPLGISYTINLNLPATTEIEVFNSIFKSLRDNLLEGE